ncbi:MAG: hypothetical protein HY455_02510 [Parcubacteria group bacterium]|nr:hypothetical protein [Parcubacteria group bacterium]
MTLYVFLGLGVLALVELLAIALFRTWEFRTGRVAYPSEEGVIFDLRKGIRTLLALEHWAKEATHVYGEASMNHGWKHLNKVLNHYQIIEKLSRPRELLKGRRQMIENANPSAIWSALNSRKEQSKDEEK